MPFTLTMPKLSPTMEEGTLTKWRKKVGDFVKAGDVLFEVATDKATVEHSALDAGWLRKILVEEGQDAIVNQAVAIFTEQKDESIEGYEPEGVPPKSKTAAPSVPEEKKEELPTARGPKATIESGLKQPSFVPEPPLAHYEFSFSTEAASQRIPASPLAKKLAKEQGIDLSTIKGSGPGGRILSSDLSLGQPDLLVTFGRRESPSVLPGTYEEEALTPMRKIIAERLQQSKTFIPHFYVSQDVDVGGLSAMREQLKNGGIKLSVNDFIVRACALALRKHPEVNSGFNSANSTLIRFKTIDISIAVSLPTGLITPIVRHADYKNVGQLSLEIKQLANRAKAGKLAREEYVGGSFTVSNLGMFGISEFTGIINPPQAALLAIGGIEDKPVVKEGAIVIGKIMRLTLSADHRVIDGADGARFIKTLQNLIENPVLLTI